MQAHLAYVDGLIPLIRKVRPDPYQRRDGVKDAHEHQRGARSGDSAHSSTSFPGQAFRGRLLAECVSGGEHVSALRTPAGRRRARRLLRAGGSWARWALPFSAHEATGYPAAWSSAAAPSAAVQRRRTLIVRARRTPLPSAAPRSERPWSSQGCAAASYPIHDVPTIGQPSLVMATRTADVAVVTTRHVPGQFLAG